MGRRWHNIRNGLSAAPVRDLLIHPRDNALVIATHGRGLYVLDDLAPLQQLGTALASDVTLFDPKPAVRWVMWSSDGNLGQKVWSGKNPPTGAVLHYYLKTPQKDVRIDIKDADGKVIQTMRNQRGAAGVNAAVWNLTMSVPGGGDVPQGPAAGGGGGRFGFGGGPSVVPGQYTVSLNVGGREFTKPLTVELDPRASVTTADLVAQRDAAVSLGVLSNEVNGIVSRTDNLITQLTGLVTNIRRNAPKETQALNEAETALKELKTFRDTKLARPLAGLGYRQYPRLREEVQSLRGSVSRGISRPTDAQVLRSGELRTETGETQQQLNTIINTRIVKLNQLLKDLPHISLPGITVM
jgi:hypothetical protein